jgi:hypothetical protein
MSAARERLPNRRHSETFEIEVGGVKYRATFSKFSDGRAAEGFCTDKTRSDADTAANDSAGR